MEQFIGSGSIWDFTGYCRKVARSSAERSWRRGWDSNPRMEVLQTSPLGHLGTAPNF